MNILEKALLETIKKTNQKIITPIDSCFSTRTPKQKIKNIIRYSKKHKNTIIGICLNGKTINFKNGKQINN
tara:strand:- start:72 stop:284 length:213 start_codon:yes stop_codon:yes gene_type:complete